MVQFEFGKRCNVFRRSCSQAANLERLKESERLVSQWSRRNPRRPAGALNSHQSSQNSWLRYAIVRRLPRAHSCFKMKSELQSILTASTTYCTLRRIPPAHVASACMDSDISTQPCWSQKRSM